MLKVISNRFMNKKNAIKFLNECFLSYKKNQYIRIDIRLFFTQNESFLFVGDAWASIEKAKKMIKNRNGELFNINL